METPVAPPPPRLDETLISLGNGSALARKNNVQIGSVQNTSVVFVCFTHCGVTSAKRTPGNC